MRRKPLNVNRTFTLAKPAFTDLHNIGYLHRDVKPGNYTIGRAELNELRKVYILDFGMCRKFTNDQVCRVPLTPLKIMP